MKKNINFIPLQRANINSAKNVNFGNLTLEEKIAELDGKIPAEQFGELNGLLGAYRIAPSNALLEAIIAKLVAIILQKNINIVANQKDLDDEDDFLDLNQEWALAYEHFLVLQGKKDSSIEVYVRAIKRIMKDYGIADINEFRKRIYELIERYEGNDQKSHNLNISALKAFLKFMQEGCGVIITYIDKYGCEYVVDRIYCTPDKAISSIDEAIEDYRDCAVKVRMINVFGEEISSCNV